MTNILEFGIFLFRALILLSTGYFLFHQIPLWKLNGDIGRVRHLTIYITGAFFLDMLRQIITRICALNGIPPTSLAQEHLIFFSTLLVAVVCGISFVAFRRLQRSGTLSKPKQ